MFYTSQLHFYMCFLNGQLLHFSQSILLQGSSHLFYADNIYWDEYHMLHTRQLHFYMCFLNGQLLNETFFLRLMLPPKTNYVFYAENTYKN